MQNIVTLAARRVLPFVNTQRRLFRFDNAPDVLRLGPFIPTTAA